MGPTRGWLSSCARQQTKGESHSVVPREGDVHTCGPSAGAWCPPCLSRPLSHPGRWWSGPDTDSPEMRGTALLTETVSTAPLLPPKEGRVENPWFRFVFVLSLAQGPGAPRASTQCGYPFSKKGQFPSSCSGTSASWGFGSNGKRASSPLCRGSLFSVWSQTLRVWRHVSPMSTPSQCWTAWVPSKAGQCFHWNIFRSSWGIWPQPYHPAAQDRLPTKLIRAEPGQYLDGRPPGKTRLLLEEVLVRPAGGAHPAVCVGPNAPV